MRTKSLSAVIGLLLLSSPLFASAQVVQTTSSINASLIAALTQLVQVLEQELQLLINSNGSTTGGQNTTSQCPTPPAKPSASSCYNGGGYWAVVWSQSSSGPTCQTGWQCFANDLPISVPPVSTSSTPNMVDIYRFRETQTGEHFYTASLYEVSGPLWVDEGVGFTLFSSQGTGMIPLYRCFTGSMHFVSTDPACEKYRTEGTYGYAYEYTTQLTNLSPLYRFYLAKTGDHLTTENSSEGYDNGYVLESILGYVLPTNVWGSGTTVCQPSTSAGVPATCSTTGGESVCPGVTTPLCPNNEVAVPHSQGTYNGSSCVTYQQYSCDQTIGV